MTAREQLWYLINGVLTGSYEVKTFCDEFYRIYNFETDKAELTERENKEFRELFEMAARFSDFEEDLKLPNVFYSGEEILQKVREVQKIRFVPEAEALPDEIKAIEAANKSIAEKGTISHEEIDWN